MFVFNLLFALAFSIQNAGEKYVMSNNKYSGMSGITYISSNTYAVVRDRTTSGPKGCLVNFFEFNFSDKGEILSEPKFMRSISLEGSRDTEGIAFDPLAKTIWVSDEADTSVREYDIITGKRTGRKVEIPKIIRTMHRANLSLEALTISPDGKTLWTANEETLECDGVPSTPQKGALVRLLKYTRKEGTDNWKLFATYVYECDTIGDLVPVCNGVVALCACDDDRLLVLERECSCSTFGRARIYAPSFEKASDVSKIDSLIDAKYVSVEKGEKCYEVLDGASDFTLLKNSSLAAYEGLCLGGKLSDGSYNLILIADGGAIRKISLNKKMSITIEAMSFIRSLKMR